MGLNFIINDENPIWWHFGRIDQLKNTRVWEIQDRIRIVRPADSSENIRTWLSQIQDNGCRFEEKYTYAHRQVEEQPTKRYKKNDDKSAVAMLKYELHDRTELPLSTVTPVASQITDLLGAVHRIHDIWIASFRTWSRRSSHQSHGRVQTCRKQSNLWDSKKLSYVTLKFETKIPRSDRFVQVNLISVAPTLQNLRIVLRRKQWQEQGAHEAAWKLAKSVLKLKENNRATFFSFSEYRCLPASILKPAERKFVVDSGASMHMISKEDLKDVEMDTSTKSCCLLMIIATNGELQKHGEATVYVKEFDIFLIMKVIENTLTVLSLGKFCDENGYSYEWITGQKAHLSKNGIRIQCNTENFAPIVIPDLSTSFSSGSYHSSSRTCSRQEKHWSTSFSSSFSSSSTTVSSDSETRKREGQSGVDTPPVPLSSFNVDDGTGQPVVYRLRSRKFWNPGVTARIKKKMRWMMKFRNTKESHASSFMKFL